MNKIVDNVDIESSHWDLVVIGAGLAGLSAALRASELGARVALLEQGHAAAYPCNTRFSGGILHVAHRNVRRPAGELLGFIQKANDEADPDISQALALHANRFLTWIQGQGGKFIRFGNNEALSWCMAPPRPLRAGLDWERRGPDTLMRLLSQRFAERGGQTFLGVRARALIMENGTCTGVQTTGLHSGHAWRARVVIIADGGFQGNATLFRKYIGPRPDLVVQRGAGTGQGDGLTMAIEAGAATTALDAFYGGILHRDALTDARLWPYPELDSVTTAGMIVDSTGQRFVDEGLGGVAIANLLARRDNPAG